MTNMPWEQEVPDKYVIESSGFQDEYGELFEYWKCILLINHFFVSICKYDHVTNMQMHEPASAILQKLQQEFKSTDITFEDSLYKICEQCYEALKTILTHPRRKLNREHPILPAHKIREIDTRCMTWFAKQPGKKIKEKIGSGQRAMGVKRYQSFDTLENRVVVRFINDFKVFLSNRINWLPSLGRRDPLHMMFALVKSFKDSPLVDIPRCKEFKPNNVLLSDKNYNKIWRAMSWLRKYDQEIETKWQSGEKRLASIIYWKVIAQLSESKNIIFYDTFAKVEPGFNTQNNGILALQNNQWQKIDNSEQNMHMFFARHDDMMRIQFELNDNSFKITCYTSKFKDYICKFGQQVRKFKFRVLFCKRPSTLKFQVCCNKNNNFFEEKVTQHNLLKVVKKILNEIRGRFSFLPRSEIYNSTETYENVGCDYVQTTPIVYTNNKLQKTSLQLYSATMKVQEKLDLLLGKENIHIHPWTNLDILSFKHFWQEAQLPLLNDAIYKMSQSIFQERGINNFSNVAIAYPDFLDDLSQVDLRRNLTVLCDKIFFPKRSACALLGWQTLESFRELDLENKDHISVFDTDTFYATIVPYEVQTDPKLDSYSNANGIFWVRRSITKTDKFKKTLSYQHLQKKYITKYLEKYYPSLFEQDQKKSVIGYLLHTGVIEEVLKKKSKKYIPTSETNESWIKIEHDQAIFYDLCEQWVTNFQNLWKEFRREKLVLLVGEMTQFPYIKQLLSLQLGNVALKENSIYIAKVKAITDFGVFVNFGIRDEGLIHKSRLKHAKEIKENDYLLVRLDKIKEDGKLSFSLAQNSTTSFDKELNLLIKSAKLITLPDQNLVAVGAESFLDREQRQLYTYRDWLPSLYLKTQKAETQICKGQLVKPGERISLDIKDVFELDAHNEYFIFPLVRKDEKEERKHSIAYEARLDSSAFPVQKNVEVLMKVNYIYGYDTFTLIVCPKNVENAPFKQLIVKWVRGEEGKRSRYVKNEIPKMPESEPVDIFSEIKSCQNKIEKQSFLSIVDSECDVESGMIFGGKIEKVIKNGLLVDFGFKSKCYIADENKDIDLSEGESVYIEIRKCIERRFSEISTFSELKKGSFFQGEVVCSHSRGVLVDIGLENFYGLLQNNYYNSGQILYVKVGNIKSDGFFFLDEVGEYSISGKILTWEKQFARYLKESVAIKYSEVDSKKFTAKEKRKIAMLISFVEQHDKSLLPFFGADCPSSLVRKFVSDLDSSESEKCRKAYIDLGCVLADGQNKEIISALIEKVEYLDVKKIHRVLGTFAMATWNNQHFVYALQQHNPNNISLLLSRIENLLHHLERRIKNQKEYLKNEDEVGFILVPFRNATELLFGLLRLRPETPEVEAGSDFMLKLARKIKRIDQVFVKNGHQCKSRFDFEISTEDKSSNKDMSDFIFILDSYLTGEDVSSRVKIKNIHFDDES